MKRVEESELHAMWDSHAREWRDPGQICSQWREASNVDPRLLVSRASPGWWDLLARTGLTLLITREYEHLLVAMSAPRGRRCESYLPMPHPSGLAVDRRRNRVYVASTRNPNQVFTLRPKSGRHALASEKGLRDRGTLMPVSSTLYPGSLYLHDLALVGSRLYGAAAGHNAVVRLETDGAFTPVWWPRCVERGGKPVLNRNHIQLNSIASGSDLRASYFSASSISVSPRRPGHLNYPVDRQGVLFSGRTREPVCANLTRPHSARLAGGRLWVANSGYGELGFAAGGALEVVARLPGWTRGLCVVGDIAFVATSRVIPRFARYAPGLDVSTSRCAIHAVSVKSGEVLGRLEWPYGSQVFAIDWLNSSETPGLPFPVGPRRARREIELFQTFDIS